MTSAEADRVIAELSAGFPHEEWPDSRTFLWYRLLDDVGPKEGMAAAWAVIVGHKFLTPAAFMDELAHLRERHLDAQRSPDYDRPALPAGPGERFCTREENLARLANIRTQLQAMHGPLARSLSRNLPPIVTTPRADQTYFEPPAPEAEAE